MLTVFDLSSSRALVGAAIRVARFPGKEARRRLWKAASGRYVENSLNMSPRVSDRGRISNHARFLRCR
jgi:hypothetical protein